MELESNRVLENKHRAVSGRSGITKLSDFVDAHRVPLGSAVRMGRRNLFAGRRNGSRAAQILPESPGRQCPTTERRPTLPVRRLSNRRGALSKPGCLLRRPMRTADPSGSFRKNKNWNCSTQDYILPASSCLYVSIYKNHATPDYGLRRCFFNRSSGIRRSGTARRSPRSAGSARRPARPG
jgi:hypothetical protein